AEEDAGEAADGEGEEEGEGVAHRGGQDDGAIVGRGRPVEDMDGGGDGDEEGEEGEDGAGELALGGEEVVAPDDEADGGDAEAGEGDGAVAEDLLAGVDGDALAHDAHAGEDHDVDGGVGVEPEEVLVEDG